MNSPFAAASLRATRLTWLATCVFALALPALAQSGAEAGDGEAATERNVAGIIELAEGDARIVDADKKSRPALKGEAIREGDSIVTGRDGEVHLAMEDSGFLGVRPDTRMRITKYQARGEATDTSVIGLLKGALRSVTGWIGKYNAGNYQIRTPTATIGVRGTDHETLVIPQGQGDGDAGTYDKVNIGGTTLQTRHGTVDVDPGRAGFVPHGAGQRPRLLEKVPHVFKPTRHEAAFEGKHEAIHKVIEKHREEKRKLWQEKAAKPPKPKKEDHAQHPEKPAHAAGKPDKPQAADADERREQREAERLRRQQEHLKKQEERRQQKEEKHRHPQHRGSGN